MILGYDQKVYSCMFWQSHKNEPYRFLLLLASSGNKTNFKYRYILWSDKFFGGRGVDNNQCTYLNSYPTKLRPPPKPVLALYTWPPVFNIRLNMPVIITMDSNRIGKIHQRPPTENRDADFSLQGPCKRRKTRAL